MIAMNKYRPTHWVKVAYVKQDLGSLQKYRPKTYLLFWMFYNFIFFPGVFVWGLLVTGEKLERLLEYRIRDNDMLAALCGIQNKCKHDIPYFPSHVIDGKLYAPCTRCGYWQCFNSDWQIKE